jgi:hypothetical protein
MNHIVLQREIITRALEESPRAFVKHRQYIVDQLKDAQRP